MTNPFDKIWEDIEDAAPPPPADNLPTSRFAYPPDLPHDLARCMSEEEVELLRAKHRLTAAEFEFILERHDFKLEYTQWVQQLSSTGNAFKLKCKALSEAYLVQIGNLLHDPVVAPSVKADLFKYLTKCAELEPTKKDAPQDTGPKIVVNIAPFAAAPERQTIEVTARKVQDD